MINKITDQVRKVYGVSQVYPVCEQAKLLAAIAGTKTLKHETLAYAERMGFSNVKEGDTLCYGDGTTVLIERVSEARCDGWIGLHGNNDTFSTWFKPTDRVRIERGLSLAQQ